MPNCMCSTLRVLRIENKYHHAVVISVLLYDTHGRLAFIPPLAIGQTRSLITKYRNQYQRKINN